MLMPGTTTRCPDPAELKGLIAGRPPAEAIALERRAVEHLDRPCARCWGTLRRLAEDAETFAPWLVAAHWRAVTRPHEVPLALVLARAAAGPLAAGAAHQRPVVRYFLAWAGDRPLAVTRLVLEECRSLALRHGDGLERMRAAAPWLEASPAAKCHPERFRDLGHLMNLFLISVHDAEKGGPGVGERLLRLRSQVVQGRDGPAAEYSAEVEATILEGYADALLRRRSLSDAKQAMIDFYLDEADDLLAPLAMPGRRAENLVRRGSGSLRRSRLDEAEARLEAALREIPQGTDPTLRWFALHKLAAVALERGDTAACRRWLEAGDEPDAVDGGELDFLPRPSSPSRLEPRRRWMWARVHEQGLDLAAAESAYREAVRGLLAEGSRFHAVSALVDLYCMYTRTNDEEKLQQLDRQMPVWLEVAELESWEPYQLERLRQKAEACGLRNGGGPVNPNRRSRWPRPPNVRAKGIDHGPTKSAGGPV